MAELLTKRADGDIGGWLEETAAAPHAPKDFPDLADIDWESVFYKQAARRLLDEWKRLGPQEAYNRWKSKLAAPSLTLRRK